MREHRNSCDGLNFVWRSTFKQNVLIFMFYSHEILVFYINKHQLFLTFIRVSKMNGKCLVKCTAREAGIFYNAVFQNQLTAFQFSNRSNRKYIEIEVSEKHSQVKVCASQPLALLDFVIFQKNFCVFRSSIWFFYDLSTDLKYLLNFLYGFIDFRRA
jgi:hypothetical protein